MLVGASTNYQNKNNKWICYMEDVVLLLSALLLPDLCYFNCRCIKKPRPAEIICQMLGGGWVVN